jgi:leader peptidase (prepilin peptidase) / N-methyltransferase
MEMYWYVFMGIFGAIIGSFLNVVIYRLHTGKSLQGRSHCLSCQKKLSWFELLPLFSYVALRGKCHGCTAYIPFRYLFVEILTAALFTLLWHALQGNLFLLALFFIISAACVVIAVYDIRHTIIPDECVLILIGCALAYLGYDYFQYADMFRTGTHILAGVLGGAFFFSLWMMSKGRWIGLGDAKLALPFGMIVGIESVFSLVVLSFWIGAIVSVLLLVCVKLLKRGKPSLHFRSVPLTMKSEVPFAPFLIIAFFLVEIFCVNVFDFTYVLFSSY